MKEYQFLKKEENGFSSELVYGNRVFAVIILVIIMFCFLFSTAFFKEMRMFLVIYSFMIGLFALFILKKTLTKIYFDPTTRKIIVYNFQKIKYEYSFEQCIEVVIVKYNALENSERNLFLIIEKEDKIKKLWVKSFVYEANADAAKQELLTIIT